MTTESQASESRPGRRDGRVHPPPARVITGELPADAAFVAALRRAVVELARAHGAPHEALAQIGVAVTEAAANVVRHAYRPGDSGALRFIADVEDGDLQVVVADEGGGIDDDGRRPGAGLGLQIIAATTSDFAITTLEPTGLELWMRFVFTPLERALMTVSPAPIGG